MSNEQVVPQAKRKKATLSISVEKKHPDGRVEQLTPNQGTLDFGIHDRGGYLSSKQHHMIIVAERAIKEGRDPFQAVLEENKRLTQPEQAPEPQPEQKSSEQDQLTLRHAYLLALANRNKGSLDDLSPERLIQVIACGPYPEIPTLEEWVKRLNG